LSCAMSVNEVPSMLLSVFTNIAECMKQNASLVQKAINDGVFETGSSAAAPSGQKKRGRAKAKDSDGDDTQKQPKRTKSGYIMFAEEERKAVVADTAMGSLTPKEIMAEVGKRWTGLGADGKKVWQDKAQILKAEAVAAGSASAVATCAAAAVAESPAASTDPGAAAAAALEQKARRKAEKKALKQAAAGAAAVTTLASPTPAAAAPSGETPASGKKKRKADKESDKQQK